MADKHDLKRSDPTKHSDPSKLIQELEQHLALTKLQERFEQQAKDHRESLEKQLDRTMKVLYAVAAIIAGGASFFGIKTYWDMGEKLKFDVSQRIEKLIDKEFVTEERDKRIAEYRRGAVLGYYATKASDPASLKIKLPEQDILTVLEALERPDSPYFRDALRVISVLSIFREEHANRFSKKLTESFVKIVKEATISLSSDTQVLLVDAMAALRDSEAFKPLLDAASNGTLPSEVRTAILRALPQVCPKERRQEAAGTLLGGSDNLRTQNASAYMSLLESVLRLDMKTGLGASAAVAKSKVVAEVGGFHELLDVLIPKGGYYSDDEVRTKAESTIKEFLTNNLVRGLEVNKRDRGSDWSRTPKEPGLTLWISEGGESGSAWGYSAEVFLNPVFLDGIINKTVISLSDVDRSRFLINWVGPLAAFGADRFEYEKAIGRIGSNADEGNWCDGFSVRLVSSASEDSLRIISVQKAGVTVIDGKTEGKPEVIAFDKIDWSSLMWNRNSYSSRAKERM